MLETWLLMVILASSTGSTQSPALTSHQFHSLQACDRALLAIRATAASPPSPTSRPLAIHTAVCVPQQ
jgi:hypothetical protein